MPMPTAKRTDYSRRPKAAFVPYPAQIIDPAALDELGVIPGTRPDEDPPKVVMTLADWRKVVASPALAKRAIRFLGKGADNPLKGLPGDPLPGTGKTRPRKPGPFDHLRDLPPEAAMARAREEHEARVAAGEDQEASLATLIRALETVKRLDQQRVISAPLLAPAGEEPPTPTELRKNPRLAEGFATYVFSPEPVSRAARRKIAARAIPRPKAPAIAVPSPRARISYPAEILDHGVLDELRLVWGTVTEEQPPKVIMGARDWKKLLGHPRASEAVRFLGNTAEDNPLLS